MDEIKKMQTTPRHAYCIQKIIAWSYLNDKDDRKIVDNTHIDIISVLAVRKIQKDSFFSN
jgi:hypothetical protein